MMKFGTVVDVLCALTALLCAVLLLRGYGRSRFRLLLWSGLCFVGLTLNNIMLVIDVRILTSTDLSIVRIVPAVAGVLVLLFGLIWEAR